MIRSREFLILALLALPEASAKPETQPAFLDIVVRDQNGALIHNLKEGEFEIIDNGAGQELESVEFEPRSAGLRLVTMVFGGLSNAGRQFARQAAHDFLKERPKDEALISVFVIDRRLYALESFTRDNDLGESIQMATSGAFEKFIKASDRIQESLSKKKNPSDYERVIIEVLGRAGKAQKEDWTYAALDSLNILVEELGKLPGRKPVIFFSEGLVIRDVMFNRFKFLVSAANLNNAPIYTVDSRGLLASSVTQQSQEMLSDAREASQSQFGAAGATSSQVLALESASQSVRMNVQEALANLSGQTGGFLIANTNDSLPGMKRMVEELNGYYRVRYTPNRSGDGTFRTVSVKVARPHVRVQAASGYFDMPGVGGQQVFSYELPLLSFLSAPEISNPFTLEARLFRFGRKPDGIQHTFAMAAPLRHFTFASDEKSKQYSTHFSLMGLLKDSQGKIIGKFSQDYPLQGPLDKMQGMKSGNVLFLRNVTLPPGDYTLEVAALDYPTGTTSGVRIPVKVESWPEGPALSDVLVIDRVDPVSDKSREQDNPLRYQDQKLAPNMGALLVKDPNAQLGLYCVVYPSSQISAQPKLGVLFFRNGQPLFKGEPSLPEPDEEGKMQVVLNLPLANFQPGDYQVIALVQQGEAAVERRVSFSIAGR